MKPAPYLQEEMLTRRFNIWCQGATPWMGAGAWAVCKNDYTEDDLQGMECYAGLDLSSTRDIGVVQVHRSKLAVPSYLYQRQASPVLA